MMKILIIVVLLVISYPA
ncbi:type I toxin-antitoxin system Ibs family toxin, partial [Escherichia coli]